MKSNMSVYALIEPLASNYKFVNENGLPQYLIKKINNWEYETLKAGNNAEGELSEIEVQKIGQGDTKLSNGKFNKLRRTLDGTEYSAKENFNVRPDIPHKILRGNKFQETGNGPVILGNLGWLRKRKLAKIGYGIEETKLYEYTLVKEEGSENIASGISEFPFIINLRDCMKIMPSGGKAAYTGKITLPELTRKQRNYIRKNGFTIKGPPGSFGIRRVWSAKNNRQ